MALRPGLATGLPLSRNSRASFADCQTCRQLACHFKYGTDSRHCQTERPLVGGKTGSVGWLGSSAASPQRNVLGAASG